MIMDLRIVNLWWEKGVDVRLIPVTEASVITDANEQLTKLDDVDVQYGVHLSGDPIVINCAGSLNQTSVMDIICPVRLTFGEDGIPKIYDTIEEVIAAFEENGLVVEPYVDETSPA